MINLVTFGREYKAIGQSVTNVTTIKEKEMNMSIFEAFPKEK